MSELIDINGRIYTRATARISVFDRSFLYGDSLYETLRTYDGHVFALPRHFKRMALSARRLGIRLPFTQKELGRRISRILKRARNGESYVRVIVTRGEGPVQLAVAPGLKPNVVIIVKALQPPTATQRKNGIALWISTIRRMPKEALDPAIKSGNYLNNILAFRQAQQHRAGEACMTDARGFLTEGTTSNLFLIRAGRLCTPPLDAGILAGVTRELILRLARRLAIPVSERALRPRDLFAADEVFISSSLREVLAVTRIQGRRVARSAGPLTCRLQAAFHDSAQKQANAPQ